ncbi:MAG: tryptophan-rich sensory protein [Alphaproteobacteria bacterium]|nr:tryptophan-rich sensory protein [Alphaproteobacteria bacterium]
MSILSAALAAVLALLLGHGTGALALLWWGPPAGDTPLAPWMFGAVWTVLYPCFGVGAATLWAHRGDGEAAPLALALGGCAALTVLLWMPVACAAQDPAVTALMDALAWGVVWIAAWGYRRVSRAASAWLLPLVLWMPVTFGLSLWAAL